MERPKPWITQPTAKNRAPQSGLRPGNPFGVPPPSAAPPPHKWMACGHDCLLKRGKPRKVAPPPQPEPAPVRHQGSENQQPRQEGSTGRPSARWQRPKGGTCRPWLIDGRAAGKACGDGKTEKTGLSGKRQADTAHKTASRAAGRSQGARSQPRAGRGHRSGRSGRLTRLQQVLR